MSNLTEVEKKVKPIDDLERRIERLQVEVGKPGDEGYSLDSLQDTLVRISDEHEIAAEMQAKDESFTLKLLVIAFIADATITIVSQLMYWLEQNQLIFRATVNAKQFLVDGQFDLNTIYAALVRGEITGPQATALMEYLTDITNENPLYAATANIPSILVEGAATYSEWLLQHNEILFLLAVTTIWLLASGFFWVREFVKYRTFRKQRQSLLGIKLDLEEKKQAEDARLEKAEEKLEEKYHNPTGNAGSEGEQGEEIAARR